MSENDRDAHQSQPGHEPPWPGGAGSYGADHTQPEPADPWSWQAREPGGAGQAGAMYGSGYPAYGGMPPMPPAQAGQGATGPQPAGGGAGGRPRRFSTALLVIVTAIALVAGGAAGALGGYLVADGTGIVSGSSGLNQPPSEQTEDAPEGSVEAVAKKVNPSVVQLQVAAEGRAGRGSGVIISEDGHIMTNSHVVAPGGTQGRIQVQFHDGQRAEAELVGHDPTTDVAVIQAEGVDDLTPAQLGRSDNLDTGERVVAIGSPFALSGTVTSGIISALDRPVRAGGTEGDQATVLNAIQTDAAINPGNSGGPLTDMSGRVIGINSAIYSPGQALGGGSQGNVGIGFAIPIDQARRTAEEIIDTGQATQTYIGALVSDARGGGVQIREVQSGSPAEEAGLEQGDVITEIGDRRTEGADTLIAEIRTRTPGDTVTLTLEDDSTLEITLGGKPVETG
ncbi:trypsin-like peptidase domain-containing protein [Haloechinothrix sp. YIM 98757]|uniref:Trypsin-like peptidase domain-containing protein n=1 Tax=Haloechinothrix aidingensis TaxID=2752311 RepID=A0A838ADD1_9PSEU|nr:trypsin-like peptidase domain-containing protein [Haloechinothrix aidingensis]MBA0127148.1 trypsin-like peptidase domain-containing protein [Haloechinothrix aidingensis]